MEDQFKKLEADVLRQEHRLFALVANFFTRKSKFPDPTDIRRSAVAHAFWMNFWFSPTVAIAGGGIVALLSLVVLFWQTFLLQSSLFPPPEYHAIVRPLVLVDEELDESRPPAVFPDFGIEQRRFDFAFAANDAGPFLVDIVNLRVQYTDANGTLIRESTFKADTALPLVRKASIEPVKVKFNKLDEVPISFEKSKIKYPITANLTFAVAGLDASTQIWSEQLNSRVIIVDGGEGDVRQSDIYMTSIGDALRVKLILRSPYDLPGVN